MRIREVTTGTYPWDLADEGADTVMENAVRRIGCNAICMVGIMHYEKRPHSAGAYYPHNPVRKEYLPEDSRAYWQPDPAAYVNSRIKPATSDREFLKHTDWVDVFSQAAHRHGLKAGIEISHTPLDYARADAEFSDVVQRDIYGNRYPDRFGQCLCHYNSDARAYLYAMAYDLAKNHDIEILQSCIYLFNPGRSDLHSLFGVALGGCFCPSCAKAAEEQGLDWELIRSTMRRLADGVNGRTLEDAQYFLKAKNGIAGDVKLLMELPEFYDWLRFRTRGTAGMYKAMRDGAKAGNPKVDFRFNTCWPQGDLYGQDLSLFAQFCDSIRVMEYSEQFGDPALLEKRKPAWLTNVRREIGNDTPMISSVAIRPMATPDLIKRGIKIAADCGADGLSFAFYDGAPFTFMEAAKQGMAEAELTLE